MFCNRTKVPQILRYFLPGSQRRRETLSMSTRRSLGKAVHAGICTRFTTLTHFPCHGSRLVKISSLWQSPTWLVFPFVSSRDCSRSSNGHASPLLLWSWGLVASRLRFGCNQGSGRFLGVFASRHQTVKQSETHAMIWQCMRFMRVVFANGQWRTNAQ